MYVSWRWISEMVDTEGVDPQRFAERFTVAVAEIDGVTSFGSGLQDVRIATVVDVQPHPSADKLRLAICKVDGEDVTVVCGAPDLVQGGIYPFAPPGVTLPSGIEVRDGEIRGVRSPGMLCSERDLGLSDDHEGLLSLDGVSPSSSLGFADAVGLPDTLWEIDNKSITHRPDLWGAHGVAREVAALLRRPLSPLDVSGLAFGSMLPVQLDVEPDAHCSRYLCARVRDVQIKRSPVQLRLRLRALGVRPINNVVDATNLVMLETGNPLHAFDARHIRGNTIRVRRAQHAETLRTLDGTERQLSTDDCVIADAQGPIALAGVMGGENSEIRHDTTTIVLEAASFDGAAIRKTATRQGMRTESSARFEKHLDPNVAKAAALRFLKLVCELCPHSKIDSDLADRGVFTTAPPAARVVHTSSSYLRSRLGVTAAEAENGWLDATLSALGFQVQRNDDLMDVLVPSFRAGRDVGLPEDLVEEVGRIYGYDRVQSATPLVPSRPPILPATKRQERLARTVCSMECGLAEVMLYSFDDEPLRKRLGLAELDLSGEQLPRAQLRNALSTENTHLRRTLASNLLGALETNLMRGTRREASKKGLRVGLFEIGRAFEPERPHMQSGVVDHGVPSVAFSSSAGNGAFVGRMPAALREGTSATAAFAADNPLPAQPRHLAIAIGERIGGGALGDDDVILPTRALSLSLYRNVLGVLEQLVSRASRPPLRVVKTEDRSAPNWVHPARGGLLLSADTEIGRIAMLHPNVRGRLQVPADVAMAEIDLDVLLGIAPVATRGNAPPRFPATSFDVTLSVSSNTKAADLRVALQNAAQRAHNDVVEDIALLSDYTSDAQRALTYRVTCRHRDRTLTDVEVAAVRATVETIPA